MIRRACPEAFQKFHAENPHVYAVLHKFALQMKRSGRKCFGIGALWERVRWYSRFEIETDEEIKLNDHHRAFYARLLMANDNELCDFFRTRRSVADRGPR